MGFDKDLIFFLFLSSPSLVFIIQSLFEVKGTWAAGAILGFKKIEQDFE